MAGESKCEIRFGIKAATYGVVNSVILSNYRVEEQARSIERTTSKYIFEVFE